MIKAQLRRKNRLNNRMKEQLESLCKHPHRFHGTEEEQNELLSRMKSMLAQDRISINDLMDIARGFDLNLKSMLMMACTSYRIIFEDTIIDCIERDDLDSLLFITSIGIASQNGRFYTVNNNRIREANEISEDIMNRLREYLLKKGYPLNARNVSIPASFFSVKHLKDALCDEDTLMRYVFLDGGIEYPFTDSVSIAFINQLADEDKEYMLDQLLNAYKKFRYERVDDDAIMVEDERINMYRFIQKADFESLETESPKKAELIELQNRYFR